MKSKGFNAHNKYMILKYALKENNVSRTCELFGISRTTFYNWQRAYEKHGMVGLEIKEPQKPQMPNKVSKAIEQEILAYVGSYPADGPKRIYYELRAEGIDIGETGIYNVLRRNNLTRKDQRVQYSKNKASHVKTNRKDNKEILGLFNKQEVYPGYLVIQRIDFMGTFDGIGKIYQYSIYDTASKWVAVKLYNKKQDIDIWSYFERKLGYLLKLFNINIKNLATDRKKEFLPYFVKDNEYKEVIEELHINHIFIPPEDNVVLEDMMSLNKFLVTEFYNKVPLNNELDSFVKVEHALNKFIREYNFYSVIPSGCNADKTPVEVVLERASQNNVDLDTLPLWIMALINYSRRGGKGE
jgi:transposase